MNKERATTMGRKEGRKEERDNGKERGNEGMALLGRGSWVHV